MLVTVVSRHGLDSTRCEHQHYGIAMTFRLFCAQTLVVRNRATRSNARSKLLGQVRRIYNC